MRTTESLRVTESAKRLRRCTAEASVDLRPFRAADRGSVFSILSVLPSLYPGGYSWLDRRLAEVLAGKARCTVAACRRRIVGVTIETHKGPRRLKLSTIYVHPSYRGLNVGARLLGRCRDEWLREGKDAVHVTADVRRAGLLLPLFSRFGFRVESFEAERYGKERDEMIFSWGPDRS